MGHVRIHLHHELVDLLPREVVGRKERIGDQERGVERRLRGPGTAHMVAVRLDEVAFEPVRLRALERIWSELLDLLEHLLRPRILRRREVADQHRHLHHMPLVGVPHALRRAVGIEPHAPLLAGVVECLLVRERREPVAAAEFLNEFPGVLAGPLAAEGGGKHKPGAILFGQRIHRLRVDVATGEPGGRQPAALGERMLGRRQGQHRGRDEHAPDRRVEKATAHWWNSSSSPWWRGRSAAGGGPQSGRDGSRAGGAMPD